MAASVTTAFTDNWTYLKIELQWLERLLMIAIARRRQDDKAVNRVSKAQVDRVTSHWWKGLVTLDPKPGYDECPVRETSRLSNPSNASGSTGGGSKSSPASGYQQQLEARIQASSRQGIHLGLPLLRDRLSLSRFEKNVLLLAIAPEINRRYSRLYQYLQKDNSSEKGVPTTDLPTVDLALRLFCRNDQEWRQARIHLESSALIQHGVLALTRTADETLLNARLKLPSAWISYLISNQSSAEQLDQLLSAASLPASVTATAGFEAITPQITWSDLLLPEALQQQLQPLGRVIAASTSASESANSRLAATAKGKILLLTGPRGTGKTAIAHAIAADQQVPLHRIDLAQLSAAEQAAVLQDAVVQQAAVVLVESAHLWFGRAASQNPQRDPAQLQAWVAQRQGRAAVTVLTTPFLQSIRPSWRQRFDHEVTLPLPAAAVRQHLWQMAFATIPVDQALDWSDLANRAVLSAGDIFAIAQATIRAATVSQQPITLDQIQRVLVQHGHKSRRR